VAVRVPNENGNRLPPTEDTTPCCVHQAVAHKTATPTAARNMHAGKQTRRGPFRGVPEESPPTRCRCLWGAVGQRGAPSLPRPVVVLVTAALGPWLHPTYRCTIRKNETWVEEESVTAGRFQVAFTRPRTQLTTAPCPPNQNADTTCPEMVGVGRGSRLCTRCAQPPGCSTLLHLRSGDVCQLVLSSPFGLPRKHRFRRPVFRWRSTCRCPRSRHSVGTGSAWRHAPPLACW
jgi:hypothetical protein